jgi:hypothetical protein
MNDDAINHEAQAAAQVLNIELARHRKILNADELAALISPRARHEVSYDKFGAHFFTIDGVLNGKKIQGAMFAGECALIYAVGPKSAQELANAGLRSTIELIHEEYETRSARLSPVEAGIVQDIAGRRGQGSKPGQELAKLPKLKAMMAHKIAGLPWKW